MNTEKISIIVPIYNSEKYLHNCLKSIINQTYKNIEIILVDDGSTDNSIEVCNMYKKKDKRIKIVSQKNMGAAMARNNGLKNATGSFVGFVDSDDYIELNMYEVLYNNIIRNDADISICGRFIHDNKIINNTKTGDIKVLNKEDSLLELNSLKSYDMSPCDKLYKRTLFNNLQFPKVKKCEDFYLMYKLFYASHKVVYDSTPLYHYCRRPGSNSSLNIDDSYIKASISQIEFFEKNCPNILYSAKTIFAYANTIQYSLYIINNIELSKCEYQNLKTNVRKNINCVIKNNNFALLKKFQILLFSYFPIIYKMLIKIKYRR